MARQIGIIKLDGVLDNIVFYRSTDGFMARLNNPLTAERIATDPSFARTRENMAEFGRAGKGARLLRTALRSELQKVSDGRLGSRLLREMMRVVKSDAVSGRGLRNLVEGEKTLLEGFDFNATARLGSTFFAPYTVSLDRTTGNGVVTVPAFVPVNEVEAPAGATHLRINAAAVAVDFLTGTYSYAGAESTAIELAGATTAPLTLTANLGANPVGALFLVMGIEFFQEVNHVPYALNNGAFNALTIVKVLQEA
jgi:hypothetical protein